MATAHNEINVMLLLIGVEKPLFVNHTMISGSRLVSAPLTEASDLAALRGRGQGYLFNNGGRLWVRPGSNRLGSHVEILFC
eukprot:m.255920 g.255920  ORF g.255920 m.255920 type:complete len:81 (+) comp19786_c0_seq1:1670-1912(+)